VPPAACCSQDEGQLAASAASAAAAVLYVAQNFFGLEQLDRANRFRACRGNMQATGERRERGLMRYPRDEFSAAER
jgi:hypothetical protein